jgi:hypothetical protein
MVAGGDDDVGVMGVGMEQLDPDRFGSRHQQGGLRALGAVVLLADGVVRPVMAAVQLAIGRGGAQGAPVLVVPWQRALALGRVGDVDGSILQQIQRRAALFRNVRSIDHDSFFTSSKLRNSSHGDTAGDLPVICR